MRLFITVANASHYNHARFICEMMEKAAKTRGTGIAQRDIEYIREKIIEQKSIIALDDKKAVGFCYIESWDDKKYVANSGLIIHPDYRRLGLAKAIKKATFDLSKKSFPNAKLFGITTSMAVMKINSDLGYKPVTFSELTQDEKFWEGCRSCANYDILLRTKKTMCICTAMICNFNVPSNKSNDEKNSWKKFIDFINKHKVRLLNQKIKLSTKNKHYQNEK